MKNLLPIICIIFLVNCSGNQKKPDSSTAYSSPRSVETNPPNTNYQPAFKGQTRIQAVKTSTPYSFEIVNQNLGQPWGIAEFPDNRFLVTEKSGFLHLLSSEGKIISKIEGFPRVDSRGQGGLLDVLIDPDFQTNRTIYFTFSKPHENGNLTAVGKANINKEENKIENLKVIYLAKPAYDGRLHYGSRIVMNSEGNLFISTGERSDRKTRPQAQELHSALGKIIKIDKNGNAVSGNPFFSTKKALPEIYSYGHRNVQGLAIHPITGELWSSEFGPKGGDEINIISAGKNYGWPNITYGLEYSGDNIGNAITQKEGMEQPVYYWDPSVSPSGIDFYKGNISEWNNNLFVACLGGQHLIRLVIKNNRITGEERLLTNENERFRDVMSSKNGNLYAITDSGKLYKIYKKN